MLIDRGISAGEVITLKLTSGEEVIGKMIEETPQGIKLSKPLVLSMGPQGIGMVPYLFTVHPDKEIIINASAISVKIPTDKQFADQYLQGTTGIKLA